MNTKPSPSRLCLNCNCKRTMILYRRQIKSGAFYFGWFCSVCNRINPHEGRTWIPKRKVEKLLTPDEINQLPALPADKIYFCCRCDAAGAEAHHWAPKAVFGHDECEQWPIDDLCINCHHHWHDKMKSYANNPAKIPALPPKPD